MAEAARLPGVVYGDRVVKVEPFGVEPIPEQERHGSASGVLAMWLGANMSMSTWLVGAVSTALFGLPLWLAFPAVLLGAALGGAVVGLHSLFGPKLGVPQMVQSRAPFGVLGNTGPAVMSAVLIVGFYAVNSVLGAFALDSITHMGYVPALVALVVAQTALAVYGHNMVHRFEQVMAVVLGLVFLGVGFYAASQTDLTSAGNLQAPLAGAGLFASFMGALGVALSFTISYSVLASDYTRYLPSKTGSGSLWRNIFGGQFMGCGVLYLIGAAVGSLALNVAPDAPPTDMILAIIPPFFAIPAMMAVVLGAMTQNVLAAYSAGLAGLAARLPSRRWTAALAAGVIGFFLAVLGEGSFASKYEMFLQVILFWSLPWMGVVLADFFVVNRKGYPIKALYDERRRWGRGLFPWIAGMAASVPFVEQQLYTGPLAEAFPQIGDISYYVGILVAFVLYLAMGRPILASGSVE
ncbi:MAG: cytosine permease [Dehalococcoidia bacterium]|nr:cytosine permease [Dehalococcoidia bacterium]